MNPFLWLWLHRYQNNVYFCPICNPSLGWNEATVNLFCSVSLVIPFFHALFLGRTNVHQHSHTFIAVAMRSAWPALLSPGEQQSARGLNTTASLLSGSTFFTVPPNTGWTSTGIPSRWPQLMDEVCRWASEGFTTLCHGSKACQALPILRLRQPVLPVPARTSSLQETSPMLLFQRKAGSHKAQAPSALPVGGSLPCTSQTWSGCACLRSD